MLTVEILNRQILITESVLNVFRQFREDGQSKDERGGIVLGQVSEEGDRILICRASVPGTRDISEVNSFLRDRRRAQRIIEYEFYNSVGRNTYLGEWHTHCATRAIPSPQDINMIAEQFSNNDMKIGFIFLLVAAQKELFIGLYDGQKMTSIVVEAFDSHSIS
jgi:integrative and conjugative element protein (TIGR02256 family)